MHPRRFEGLETAIAFCCLILSAFLNFFLLTVIYDVVSRQPLPVLTSMIILQQKWAWSVGDVPFTVR
ncbi:Phosphatidylcholine:ceramide cholinephosphotransferase 2 [Parelaphostrongylus tenuis]|uniref:Phosphatidylcholine:ceramide cholinephosphotransferase 2 n=1 Tax=Parelaphostrongylus tenuis TaxID=148309 RepID=A0AAD5MH41_PARTN|nr:Phosphatidylcholine:ceramide cholinephosphotransferase 2 [Parelaphostrongylus tenuis]